jgi:glycosyltransferase involved in cell wall biosynthesis
LVCKPLRSPFSDGSTVLVRDLVEHLPETRELAYFGDPSVPLRSERIDHIIPAASMGHAPGMLAKVGVLGGILRPSRRRQPLQPLHFFFTPNRVTSSVVSALRRIAPGRLMIQTLMSSAHASAYAGFLRPLDAVIVLSDHTARALEGAGLEASRVHRIHPGVALVDPIPDVSAHKRILYAGDLDEQVARRLCAIGAALSRPAFSGWSLTIAARPKADEDARHRATIERELSAPIEAGRVEVLGEISDMDQLMRRCALQLFVAEHVRKKVDLPLAVLEGLARGLGLVAIDFSPLSEIFTRADSHGLQPGALVDAKAEDEALVEVVSRAAADPEVLLTWSRDARELVSREFSIERMAAEYAKLYDKLEQGHGRNR